MIGDKGLVRVAAKNVVITSIGDLLAKGLGVLTTFLILLYLTPYDYGVWRLLLSALTAMSIVGLTGLTGVFAADMARSLGAGDQKTANAIVWKSVRLFMVAGIVSAATLFLAAPFVTRFSGIDLTLYLSVLAVSLLFSNALLLFQTFFQARLEPVYNALIKNLGAIAYLAGILLLLGNAKLGVLGLVTAYLIAIALPVLACIPYFVKKVLAARSPEGEKNYSLREAITKRGRWVLANDYASILSAALWPWIMGYFVSIEAVGYAGLATLILSQALSVVPIQYVLRGILPRFSDDAPRMRDWLERSLKYAIWLHGLAALGAVLVAWIAFPIFFPSYAAALPIAALLLLAVPLQAMSSVLTEWFFATGSQRELFFTTAIPKLLMLAVLPLLLSVFGIYGFAIWYILSSDLVLALRMRKVRRELGHPIRLRSIIFPDRYDVAMLRKATLYLRTRI